MNIPLFMVDESEEPVGTYEQSLWLMLQLPAVCYVVVGFVVMIAVGVIMAVADIFGGTNESTEV